ncbi:MAG: metal-dependent transcriptional regulator [Deltaproteobacteria bacterium]|nr:metal-dependent transcriptional regulator [Deltaproteobacteria bacterium]
MNEHKLTDREVDELLEAIWVCRENGEKKVEAIVEMSHARVHAAALDALEEEGLVERERDEVQLTKAGEERARKIIRRHRLAERLVVDVLGLSLEQAEEFACHYEHSVVPEVTDGICTLLGHPRECPHGHPIPRGEDCLENRTEVSQVLMPLCEVPCARPVKVAYLRTRDHDRIHQLVSMGISPGAVMRIHQCSPLIVIEIEQSEFALDRDIAGDVYVWLLQEDQ